MAAMVKLLVDAVLSYAAGKAVECVFGRDGSIRSAMFACYERALQKWSLNEQIRDKYSQIQSFRLDNLVEDILQNGNQISGDEQQLIDLWAEEITNDPVAIQWYHQQLEQENLRLSRENNEILRQLLQEKISENQKLNLISCILDGVEKPIEQLHFRYATDILKTIEERFLHELSGDSELLKRFYGLKAKYWLFKDLSIAKDAYRKSEQHDANTEEIIGVLTGAQEPSEWNEVELPPNLEYSTLPEWIQVLFHYQRKCADFLFFRREEGMSDKYQAAFDAVNKFLMLAQSTDIEKAFAYYKSLRAYWGCVVGANGDWIREFETNAPLDAANTNFRILQKASMYLMMEEKENAVHCLSDLVAPYGENEQDFLSKMALILGDESLLMQVLKDLQRRNIAIPVALCSDICELADIEAIGEEIVALIQELKFDKAEDRLIVLGCLYKRSGAAQHHFTDEEIEAVSLELRPHLSELLYWDGQSEKAYSLYNPKPGIGESRIAEKYFLRVLRSHPEYRKELLLRLQEYRDKQCIVENMWLPVEFEMEMWLSDYDNADKTAQFERRCFPSAEFALAQYVMVSSYVDTNRLETLKDELISFPFNNEGFVLSVYSAYLQNGDEGFAIEFLYQNVLRLGTVSMKNYFFGQSVNWSKTKQMSISDVVRNGDFVLIDNGAQRRCDKITDETLLGRALIGHQVNEMVNYRVGIGTRTVTIVAIFSKYQKLLYDITQEYHDTGGNDGVQSVTFDMNKSMSEQLKQLSAYLDGDDSQSWEERQRKIKSDYSTGQIGLCNMIDGNSCYLGYLECLFGQLDVYVYPISVYERVRIFPNDWLVLDLPAAMALFEFAEKSGVIFSQRFVIVKWLYDYVEHDVELLTPDNQYRYVMAHKLGNLVLYDENIVNGFQKRMERFLKWLNDYCQMVIPYDALGVMEANDNYLHRIQMQTMSVLIGRDAILISDEAMYCDQNGFREHVISVESYIARFESPEMLSQYQEFMRSCRFQYYQKG